MARFSLPRLLYYHYTVSHSSSSSLLSVSSTFHLRHFSAACIKHSKEQQLRNIWISGLVDPAKSPVSERYMLYTGQIEKMEEARNKIQRRDARLWWDIHEEQWLNFSYRRSSTRKSSYPTQICDSFPADVTFFNWKHHKMSVIDTPDCVDFTSEVDNALRAFDAAVFVLSSVGGMNSLSISVDKQMIKYQLPRLVYINNLDNKGADPWDVLNQARSKLQHHCAAIQVPIGLEDDFKGLVDLVQLKAYYFHGEKVVVEEVPEDMEALVSEKRHELIKTVSEVDDKLAEAFCSDKPISAADLEEAVRRATIARKFIPFFMGSAFRYKGLQLLLDGVLNYLPCPTEASNYALVQSKNEEKHTLVVLAFTLKRKYGLITYLRIYEGVIRKGDFITNDNTGKTFKVPDSIEVRKDEIGVSL
ncbi:elongation factor G-2, mitochondrial [Medicago truncatula]|uniref:elongation factor G-2, mitochondrial n=1 Tax=Medicago truncatula TaxID=3880 RepID=UPI001966F475|nr:elongation factor G-2, mitochondrial [Medicago truncatula]